MGSFNNNQSSPPTIDHTRSSSSNNSNSANSTLQIYPQDVIQESLLALAKDTRYIQQCQALLWQSLESLLALLGTNQLREEQHRFSSMKKQTWFLAHALYILWVIAPQGLTLGMQACGLSFQQKDATGERTKDHHSRRRLVGSLLLTTAIGWVMEYYFRDNTVNQHQQFQDQSRINTAQGEPLPRSQQELLRGRDRWQIHEQLRRQMMTRAANFAEADDRIVAISHPINQQSAVAESSSSTPSSTAEITSIPQRIQNFLRRLCMPVLQASFHSEGPHEVVTSAREMMPASNDTSSHSMAVWLIRLHLAQYLMTGKYPTLMHRMLGLEVASENNKNHTGFVRANTHRFVALLILLQASGTLVRSTSNWLARTVAMYLENRKRLSVTSSSTLSDGHSPQMVLQSALATFFSSESITLGNEDNNADEDSCKMLQILDSTPPLCYKEGVGSQSGEMIVNRSDTSIQRTVCAICRMDRVHPAAPASCGHVCCWNCLNQWVLNVRPECPLCRAQCRPQEIIALHHYEPPKGTSETL